MITDKDNQTCHGSSYHLIILNVHLYLLDVIRVVIKFLHFLYVYVGVCRYLLLLPPLL